MLKLVDVGLLKKKKKGVLHMDTIHMGAFKSVPFVNIK